MDDDIGYLFKQPDGIENHKIPQFDGNIYSETESFTSEINCTCCNSMADSATSDSDLDYDLEDVPSIPVHISQRDHIQVSQLTNPPPWYEHYIPRVINPTESKSNRKTIQRNNRLMMSQSLPILSVSNMRSLWPKLKNFKIDMAERNIGAAMLSEVWEKTNCKKQQFELEKMLNMEGLKYISTPRLTKRGGGAAIVVSLEHYTLEKLEVMNPDKVEVVFGLMRPKKGTAKIREIIIAAFYSPPKSR